MTSLPEHRSCRYLVPTAIVSAALGIGALTPPAVSAAVNYIDVTRTVSGTGTATCPAGWKLTGGGVGTIPANSFNTTYSHEYALTGSYPSGNSWKASATHIAGSYSSTSGWSFHSYSYSPRVYAICAS